MKIKFLKAFNGDSIHINFKDCHGQERNILIDGGVSETYLADKGEKGKPAFGDLYDVVEGIKSRKQKIDLLIVSHHHDDHIDGVLAWFSEDPSAYRLITEVWFNSGGLIARSLGEKDNDALALEFKAIAYSTKTSIPQALEFGKYIQGHAIWFYELILAGKTFERHGLIFTILSPGKEELHELLKDWKKKDPYTKTAAKGNDYASSLAEHISKDVFKEDSSSANGSSIAFILKSPKKTFVFLGDSHPSVVIDTLKKLTFSADKPLQCELVKVSHHGSRGNTSGELLKILDCSNFIISTDGNKHEHPHKQFLSRLIKEKPSCNIFFNYEERIHGIFSAQDRKDFPGFKTIAITTEFEYHDN